MLLKIIWLLFLFPLFVHYSSVFLVKIIIIINFLFKLYNIL